ncbi:MAG: aminotransferase class IV [Fidelibacterota bacterium]
MIKALINKRWELVPNKNLEIGGDSFAYKSGLYETFRTLSFKPVFFNLHMDRLYNTALQTSLKIHYSREELHGMVHSVVSDFSEPNQRVRVIAAPDDLIIYTSPLNLDQEIYDGVKVLALNASRKIPAIKTTNYRTCLSAWEKAHEAGCFEAILTDNNGDIFEGSRSNVFWVKKGKLFTRQFDILPGVTREIIILKFSFPVVFSNLNRIDFKQIDELFITNSGPGIVPVTQVNDTIIRNGTVGKITRKLLNDYTTWIKNDVENYKLPLFNFRL